MADVPDAQFEVELRLSVRKGRDLGFFNVSADLGDEGRDLGQDARRVGGSLRRRTNPPVAVGDPGDPRGSAPGDVREQP